MAIKDFRFGVCVRDIKSRSAFEDTARRFEDLGFDVLSVPDHLAAAWHRSLRSQPPPRRARHYGWAPMC